MSYAGFIGLVRISKKTKSTVPNNEVVLDGVITREASELYCNIN